jgi:nucleoid-associated protein YgaU
MIRTARPLLFAVLLGSLAPAARADEKQMMQELRDVRALLEQQARQIDALTTQVARLNTLLSAKNGAAPAAAAAEAPFEAPRAEPVVRAEPEGQRHIIVKGDNLTAIAKHYNVSLSELQKANKNLNPAKLQIGQSVMIPQKAAEAPAEKKETP